MTNLHPALVVRELDALTKLFDACINEPLISEACKERDVELLRQCLQDFAEMASNALPRLEWILLNAGDHISSEHRNKFSEMRGKLCQMSSWQEAIG